MKTRIISTVLIVALWGALKNGVFYTADVVAKNTLAVATVNGGNDALLAQNTYAATAVSWIGSLIFVAILAAIWWKPVTELLSENASD